MRTAGWWLSATGLSGAVVGALQELTRRRRDVQDLSIPVAPFAGAALATVNDFRRRRWEARSPGLPADEGAPASAAKSLAMSLGVSAGLAGWPPASAGSRPPSAAWSSGACPATSASTGRSATWSRCRPSAAPSTS